MRPTQSDKDETSGAGDSGATEEDRLDAGGPGAHAQPDAEVESTGPASGVTQAGEALELSVGAITLFVPADSVPPGTRITLSRGAGVPFAFGEYSSWGIEISPAELTFDPPAELRIEEAALSRPVAWSHPS